MNWDLQLHQIMNTSVLTLSPGAEINHAMSQLTRKRYSGAPVVNDEGELVGIVTQKDCLRGLLNSHYHESRGGSVADYMSGHVETLDPGMSLLETAQRFVNSQYRRFPVMKDGALQGIVTRHDVLKAIDDQWT